MPSSPTPFFAESTAVLWVAAGGAAGAVSRYATSYFVRTWCGLGFPYGTATVNVVGSFVFGFIWAATEDLQLFGSWSGVARSALLVGFLGAFTTFSTFAFETVRLLEQGRYAVGVVNILVQNLLAVLAVYGGIVLGRLS